MTEQQQEHEQAPVITAEPAVDPTLAANVAVPGN